MRTVLLFQLLLLLIGCTNQIQERAASLDKELATKPILSTAFDSLLQDVRQLPDKQQVAILFRVSCREEKEIAEIAEQEKLLLEILPLASKREKKKLLLRLTELYNRLNNLALPGADSKGIERCKELENNYSLSQEERWNVKETKALLLTRLGSQEQYLPIWYELLEEHRTAKKPTLIIKDLYTIANHFDTLEDKEKSYDLYQEAYDLATKHQFYELQHECLIALINVLYGLEKYSEAKDYFNRIGIDSIAAFMPSAHIILAKCHLELQQPDSARFYLTEMVQKSKQESGYIVNGNIAETYISENKEDSAAFYLEKSIRLYRNQFSNNLKKDADNPLSIYFLPIYSSYAELLQRNGKIARASEAFNLVTPSMVKATPIPTQWKFQINALTKFSSFCRSTKQYEKALDLLARRDSLQSIYNIRQKDKDSKNMEDRFDILKLQYTINLQRIELGYSKQFNVGALTCGVLLLCVLIVAFSMYFSRKKELYAQMQKKIEREVAAKQEQLEKEKTKERGHQEAFATRDVPAKTKLLFRNAEKMLVSQKLYLNQRLSIDQFAEALGTNRIELSKCVNTCTKINYSKWINKYRIDYVLERIESTQNLEELWKEAGFSSSNAFYTNFNVFTKLNPTDYLIERGLEQFEDKKQKSPKKRTPKTTVPKATTPESDLIQNEKE